MTSTAVLGAQWGDEGKGKIVHLLSDRSDIDWIIRFNGGPNAGHTVVDEEGEIKFHHLPSGSVYGDLKVLLGPGMVVNLEGLNEELNHLKDLRGVDPNIYFGARAHLIMPYHPVVERLEKSKEEVGTTGRGIGPTYQDKAARSGFRFSDILGNDFTERVEERFARLRSIWDDPQELADIELERYLQEVVPSFKNEYGNKIVNTPPLVNSALNNDEGVIFEGAQGSLLDIDYGSYPYVTSSNTTVGGVGTGGGASPTRVDRRIGIVKSYTTRVGKGPLPTEETGKTGNKLREQGDEYGATTGRPRRCGWLDLPVLRYSCQINDFTGLALTKLDVLSGFDELKVAVSYEGRGESYEVFPPDLGKLQYASPNYVTMEGWSEDITNCSSVSSLPGEAREYLDFVENELEVPIEIVSVGKKRSETIIVE